MFLRNVILAAILALLLPYASPGQTHVVHASRAESGIVVDGNLSEPVWGEALPETEFTQRDPEEGKLISLT